MSEDHQTEWKTSWRDEYLKWICGFANAHGGTLVIGRNDKGEAVGVSNADKLLTDLPNKIRDALGVIPELYLCSEGNTEFIEIRVDAYPGPISYKGEFFIRSGSTLQHLRGVALEQFLLRKRGRHWDSVPDPVFTLNDSSPNAFRLFAQKASRSGRMDDGILHDTPSAILDNLELIEGKYFRRAACLLFSDKPERYVSGAWIKIGFFMTDDDLRYQDEIHGNLFEQVDKTLDLLRTKYFKAQISYDGLQRVETFPFPLTALREALLNAVSHKDYSSGVPIQISVYEDHIIFWNDGQLPNGWTVEELLEKHPSRPHNPLLANAFFRAGYIEAWGRGIQRILNDCQQYNLPAPTYSTKMSGLMVTFQLASNESSSRTAQFGEKFGEKFGGKFGEKLGTNEEKLLLLLEAEPRLSAPELAKSIGITSRAIEKIIARLRTRGFLYRKGPAKGGYWVVTYKTSHMEG
jgi:ATP-dependent DNA helicase RecG